ncbi:hypothetical protein C8029_16695 [Roseobacter sp. TSBP12]|nr:hypothetical protein C8029_16695 [Roseobacter sp. TSBP12]|tara:strand:+ start:10529 stop:10726 length:198 start_codon:yes stop_codon:yes gene_type:complete
MLMQQFLKFYNRAIAAFRKIPHKNKATYDQKARQYPYVTRKTASFRALPHRGELTLAHYSTHKRF